MFQFSKIFRAISMLFGLGICLLTSGCVLYPKTQLASPAFNLIFPNDFVGQSGELFIHMPSPKMLVNQKIDISKQHIFIDHTYEQKILHGLMPIDVMCAYSEVRVTFINDEVENHFTVDPNSIEVNGSQGCYNRTVTMTLIQASDL